MYMPTAEHRHPQHCFIPPIQLIDHYWNNSLIHNGFIHNGLIMLPVLLSLEHQIAIDEYQLRPGTHIQGMAVKYHHVGILAFLQASHPVIQTGYLGRIYGYGLQGLHLIHPFQHSYGSANRQILYRDYRVIGHNGHFKPRFG